MFTTLITREASHHKSREKAARPVLPVKVNHTFLEKSRAKMAHSQQQGINDLLAVLVPALKILAVVRSQAVSSLGEGPRSCPWALSTREVGL